MNSKYVIKNKTIANFLVFAIIVFNIYAKPIGDIFGLPSFFFSAIPLVLLFATIAISGKINLNIGSNFKLYSVLLAITLLLHVLFRGVGTSAIIYLLYYVTFAVVLSVADEDAWKNVEKAIMLVALLMSIEVITKIPTLLASSLNLYNIRSYVILDKPVYSFMLGLGSIIGFFEVLKNKEWKLIKKVAIAAVTILFAILNVLVIQSKIFILGIVISALFTYFAARSKVKRTLRRSIIVIIVAVVAVILLYPSIIPDYIYVFINRYTGLFSSYVTERQTITYDTRDAITSYAIEIFKENPLLGVGFGNYSSYAAKNFSLGVTETESTVLNMLVEGGLLGFLSYVGFMISIFMGLWSKIKCRSNNYHLVEIFCVFIMLMVLSAGNDFYNISFWTIIAFAYAATRSGESYENVVSDYLSDDGNDL